MVWFIDLRFRERNRVAERLDHIKQEKRRFSAWASPRDPGETRSDGHAVSTISQWH